MAIVGGVFKEKLARGVNSNGPDLDHAYRPYQLVPPNSDVKLSASANTSGVPISAGFDCLIATRYTPI